MHWRRRRCPKLQRCTQLGIYPKQQKRCAKRLLRSTESSGHEWLVYHRSAIRAEERELPTRPIEVAAREDPGSSIASIGALGTGETPVLSDETNSTRWEYLALSPGEKRILYRALSTTDGAF